MNLLPGLLERIEVLLFAGDQDYICNYVGQEDTIEALEWGGKRGLGVSGVWRLTFGVRVWMW